MLNFFLHVTCIARGGNMLAHCHISLKNGFKDTSLLAFGKTDHAAIFLIPKYKQMLMWEDPDIDN